MTTSWVEGARRTFEPDTASVRAARQFVTESAEAEGTDEACLQLLVSEIVSNAVLHGRTPFVVSLAVADGVLRVSVHDSSPTAPVLRTPDPTRVTGRGLGIVDALSSRWGVEPADGGKVVWFEVPRGAPVVGDDLVEVRLLGLPVQEHDRASTHGAALQRELELIRRRDHDTTSVPHRLQQLIDELQDEFGGVGEQPVDELEAAIARGDETIDLTYRIPPAAGPASRRLGELLDEVDRWCEASGHLLTLVTPPASVAYRRWFLGEFIRQCAGEPPTPWSEWEPGAELASTPLDAEPVPAPSVPSGWSLSQGPDTAEVRIDGALDLTSSPALRDLLSYLEAEGAEAVVVDLSACEFVDSVGLSVIVAADLRAREAGRTLALRIGPRVEPVLRISGLLDRLAILA